MKLVMKCSTWTVHCINCSTSNTLSHCWLWQFAGVTECSPWVLSQGHLHCAKVHMGISFATNQYSQLLNWPINQSIDQVPYQIINLSPGEPPTFLWSHVYSEGWADSGIHWETCRVVPHADRSQTSFKSLLKITDFRCQLNLIQVFVDKHLKIQCWFQSSNDWLNLKFKYLSD